MSQRYTDKEDVKDEPTQKVRRRFQRILIAHLMRGETIGKASKLTGISRRTAQRWMAEDEHFRELFGRMMENAVSAGAGFVTGTINSALSNLVKMMDDQDAPHSVRVQASTQLLVWAEKLVRMSNLSKRISDIEKRVGVDDGEGLTSLPLFMPPLRPVADVSMPSAVPSVVVVNPVEPADGGGQSQ